MASTITNRRFGVNAGRAIKVPCVVATTAPVTLAGEQTIDGVAVVGDDRVLVKDQADATENGIWNVSTGSWVRAADWNDVNDVGEGTLIAINQGSVNPATIWRVVTTGTISPELLL